MDTARVAFSDSQHGFNDKGADPLL